MRAQESTLRRDHELTEKWFIVDASGLVVGRLAARIASVLRGKTLPHYSPHLDHKVHVIVTNADKVIFTADKMTSKKYYHHSGWRTGIKETTPAKLMVKKPTEVLKVAIQGMLPKNRLGRTLNRHLRLYAAGEYNGQHDAQKPEQLVVKTRVPKPNK